MSGDKEKQKQAAGEADAPYDQARKQHAGQQSARRGVPGDRSRYAVRYPLSFRQAGGMPSNQVRTTILPPALFSSMERCASTMSLRLKTLPTWTRNVPAATCSANSSSGVSMKSLGPPS